MNEYAKKQKELKNIQLEIGVVEMRLRKLEGIECQERIDLAHKLRILRRQRDEVMS